jgi:hypothetical protein
MTFGSHCGIDLKASPKNEDKLQGSNLHALRKNFVHDGLHPILFVLFFRMGAGEEMEKRTYDYNCQFNDR